MSGFHYGYGYGVRSQARAGGGGPQIVITQSSIAENAAIGSTVGVLSVVGGTGTWTFTETADPDAKFVLAGAGGSNLNLAATVNFEAAQSHSVTIQATNGTDTISRTFTISVTNVFEAATLGALSVPSSVSRGTTVNITGATSGSTITGTMPTGWTLNGAARTIAIAAGAPTGTQSWSLTETLADSANSPRVSSGSSDVSDAPTAPTAPAYLSSVVAPYAAYGPQRMVAGYSGPLFTLRRDDGATLDVSPQAGGDYPDYAAINTWAGGNIPTVTTLHDQSGNGRHLTQATVANQPSYDTTQRYGNVVPILFDGFGRTATVPNPQRDKFLSRGGLTGLDSVTMSAFMAMEVQTTNSTGHWFGSDEAGTTASHEQNHGTTNNALTNRIAASNRNASVTTLGPFPRFGPQAFGMSVGAGTVRQFINGTSAVTGSVSTVTVNIDRLTLGKTLIGGSAYFGAYRLFGYAFYASAVSQANGDAIIASLNAAYAYGNGYNVAPEYNVLIVGDSITEGTGSRLIRNMASQLAANLTRPRRFYNWGIHGETMATAFAARTGRYTATFTAGIPNVAFIQIGTNDIGNGAAGATLYSGTTTPFVTFLQGLGYQVVVCTLLPRANAAWTAAMETERVAYNAAVRANAAAANAVLDLTANPTMGPNAAALDTALYPDNLHPNNLGYAYLAGAPSGIYANANTYYDALRAVLRTTALGAGYVP